MHAHDSCPCPSSDCACCSRGKRWLSGMRLPEVLSSSNILVSSLYNPVRLSNQLSHSLLTSVVQQKTSRWWDAKIQMPILSSVMGEPPFSQQAEENCQPQGGCDLGAKLHLKTSATPEGERHTLPWCQIHHCPRSAPLSWAVSFLLPRQPPASRLCASKSLRVGRDNKCSDSGI